MIAVSFACSADQVVELDSFGVVFEDDVDHSGDGVRAVLGRGTVAQNFNAFDRSFGNGIEIDAYGAAAKGAVDVY